MTTPIYVAQIVPVPALTPTTSVSAQFPNQALPVNDEWLQEQGFARLLGSGDYAFDRATQKLVAITPALDADANVVNSFEVQSLSSAELLANSAAAKIAALGAQYDTRLAAGFNYAVASTPCNFQCDDASGFRMSVIKLQIGASVAGPGYWVDSANSMRTFSDADLVTFFNAVYAYRTAMDHNFFVKRAAALAAAQQSDLDAIDPTAGWPSD